jgi:hypothetical protein
MMEKHKVRPHSQADCQAHERACNLLAIPFVKTGDKEYEVTILLPTELYHLGCMVGMDRIVRMHENISKNVL